MLNRVQHKKSPARRLQQGAVSDKCPVLTGHGRESERQSELHRYDSASGHIKRRGPPPLGEGPRESSSDLLSRARGPGTIGDEGLDFRVRKGNGYDPLSVTAETISLATYVEKTFCTA